MKTFKMTLGANETRPANVNGEFFFLRFAQYPLPEIKLLGRNGDTVSILEDAVTTDWDRSGPFERVEVTNGPTPQTIYFRYGNGDTGSNVFSGNVTGSIVTLDAPTIAALIAGKYNVRPEVPTHTLNDATAAIMGTSVAPLVPIADNPNGLIILGGYLQDFGVVSQCMLAKNAAPVAVNDGMCILTGCAPGYSSAGAINERVTHPFFVPAGFGIWLRSDAATGAAAASRRGLNYIKL